MSSKVSTSENTSDLLFAFKDYKKDENGRPIATGNSGNTRALSNSVSDFVEAVANSEREKESEVISSEDLMFNPEVVKECKDCTMRWTRRMEEDYEGCEPGIAAEERKIFQLGLDVVVLFPSIISERTGIIVRKRVYKSPLKMMGFE